MGKTDFFQSHFRSRPLQLWHCREVTRGHDKSIPDRDECSAAEACKRKYRAIISNHGSGLNQVEKTVPGNDNRPQCFEPLKTAGCDNVGKRARTENLAGGHLRFVPWGLDNGNILGSILIYQP